MICLLKGSRCVQSMRTPDFEITQHYTSRFAQKQRSAAFPAPAMHGLSVRFSGRLLLRNFPRAAC